MNIGPLKIGDFLGIVIITLCIRTILHSVFSQHTLPSYLLTHSIDCSNWSDIFCDRFCLHLAGINGNEAVVLEQLTKEMLQKQLIHFVCAGAQSGRDTSAIQPGFRGRRSKWCHISGAFQCNPELWPVSLQLKHCLGVYWKLFVFICHKHHAGSFSKCLSLWSHACALSWLYIIEWHFVNLLQAGLLSAYMIKKLYFGRFVFSCCGNTWLFFNWELEV